MAAKIFLTINVMLLLAGLSDCSKILVVFPFPSKSHGILGEGAIRHLLNAGHDVTYITPFPPKNIPQNLKIIDLSSNVEADALSIKDILDKKINLQDSMFLKKIMLEKATQALQHENVQKLLLDTNEHFDVVVVEWMFSNIYLGISEIFKCPHIWFIPFNYNSMVLGLLEGWSNPAYNPGWKHGFIPPLNFVQRAQELWSQLQEEYYNFLFQSTEEESFHKVMAPIMTKRGRSDMPDMRQLQYNISMILVNNHFSLSYPVSAPLNYIEVGGYHVNDKVDKLPQDLEQIMNNSKNGVIYFSMGSNLKSKDLPVEMKNDLLEMFGTLKQTVLWKFEEELPNSPKNVKILKWAPQTSILSHPNCVLFITHGGLLSTTETIHFGVPIIGIPVFADQFSNVDIAVQKGFAKRVDLSYDMAQPLKNAIIDILADPKYKQIVKELSFTYHHRIAPPGKAFAHWVDYVALTRGAVHLRSPAFMLAWYQRLYIDLLAIILLILTVIAVIIKKIYRLIFSRKKKEVQKKKKN